MEYIEDGEHSVLFYIHITGDLERAADYITYISYGELFYSGGKDEFVNSFKIVKGGCEELSADLSKKMLGIRKFTTGFEALVKTEDLKQFALQEKNLSRKNPGFRRGFSVSYEGGDS